MIDVEKKIIYFGHGDIQVSSGIGPTITFTGFKDTITPGTIITDEVVENKNIEFITKPIKIVFTTMEELNYFKTLVDEIDMINCTYFEYHGYIFDFSNYNQNSINVIYKSIEKAKLHFITLMAC